MNLYEVAGVLFGIVSVFLTVRESIWCWPTGIVNVALFVIVFHEAKLYADMGLQVVYLALCAFGWYEWLHGGRQRKPLHVSRAPRPVILGLALAGVVLSLLLGGFLSRATDASLPFWDASTTSFSLVGQALLTRKWIENWIVWIMVDLVYVGIYVDKQLYPTAALYGVFLAMALLGLKEWSASLQAKR